MNADLINPFLTATAKVFETMLGCELRRGDLHFSPGTQPIHEVSGIIGLSGKAAGTAVLSVSREVALSATETMCGCRPDDIDADVADVIGELANMIVGSAKAQLERYSMSISLPSVVVGRDQRLSFPPNVQPIAIPYACKWGDITVEVGLREE